MNVISSEEVSPPERRRLQARARRLARRAETLADAGRVDEAIECQSEVAALRPDDSAAFFRLGLLYREARRIEPAVDALRRAQHLSPGERDPREALIETLLEAGRFNEVIAEGKALVRLAPRSLFARDVLCVAYLQMGQIDKAVRVAGEMIFLDPLSPVHHFKRAMLLQQQGSLKAAVGEYARALDMAAPDSEIHNDAAEALQSLDEYQIHQILLLASEDRYFRQKLRQDTVEAAAERGFFLSEGGQARLQALAQHQFLDAVGAPSVAAWGGVRFYN
ncbi:MAG: tetratricopeptide repeat protein [Armatimonadetes bacterium]|nr:tetratricopeptide repeat protein [Armatimonadota bacterium]